MIAQCSGLTSEREKVAFYKMQILETYVQPRDQIFQFYNFHKITAGLTGTATAGLQISVFGSFGTVYRLPYFVVIFHRKMIS
jgi:hypothetical protein